MNRIDKVEIWGFWGNRHIKIKLFQYVNLFIGVNGSGKTTIINIIASALQADVETLVKMPFSKIRLDLSEVKGKRKPSIEVEKIQDEPLYENIIYRFKDKASDKYIDYPLNEIEGRKLLRKTRINRHRVRHTRLNPEISRKLESTINIKWLTIHRTNMIHSRYDEDDFESSVDQKLDELNRNLSRYFSRISSNISDEISKFQKNIISSMITEQAETTILTEIESFDLAKEKTALTDIFQKLQISNNSKNKLDTYFNEVDKARKKLMDTGRLNLDDVMILGNLYRSHKVVEEWNKLLNTQSRMLASQRNFVEILNNLLQRKTIKISQLNEIIATTDSEKELSVHDLSSGEKQLVIILGEALLQQSQIAVYITDEPELSMHISWQEKLIENVKKLNPNAQIICATHSPDVVGNFSSNIFDMEKIINESL